MSFISFYGFKYLSSVLSFQSEGLPLAFLMRQVYTTFPLEMKFFGFCIVGNIQISPSFLKASLSRHRILGWHFPQDFNYVMDRLLFFMLSNEESLVGLQDPWSAWSHFSLSALQFLFVFGSDSSLMMCPSVDFCEFICIGVCQTSWMYGRLSLILGIVWPLFFQIFFLFPPFFCFSLWEFDGASHSPLKL